MTAPAPAEEPTQRRRNGSDALLRSAYAHLPLSVTFSLVALLVFMGLLEPYLAPPVFHTWVALMVLAVVVRGLSGWLYRRRGWPAGTQAPPVWRRAYMAGALLSSLCWSFGPTWHLAHPDARGASVMSGALLIVCAAAVPAMAAQPRALMLFLVGAMAPPALAAWFSGGADARLLALEMGFGLGVLLLAAVRIGRTMAAQYLTQQQLKQTAAQAEAMRAQAESASLAKTRFLANMSHELRTPLNAVIGAAQLLRAEAADAERQGQLVEAIQQGGRNLLGLIENILDLSRIEAGALTLNVADFDLVECVEAALSTAALSARAKGLALACVVDPALPAWRHGDAARLRQVLLNLLGNAVKFTLRGEVVLRVQPGATPQSVRLSVSDTGVGMPADTLARVFEPFRQGDEGADRRFGGSGLGLAIVHQLVQAMGGQVQVRSRPGLGSSFTLELPLPVAQAPVPQAPRLGHRVAFVEPHEASAEALQALLQRLGCDARRCRDGHELRTWLAGAPPDAPPAWLLLASDASEADELLAAAIDWIEPERVISLAAEFSLEASAARDSLRMASELLKPVTRAALAGRLGPRAQVRPPASAAAEAAPQALLTQEAYERLTHVLVVEDDALNRAIVSGLLVHAGCRVTEAGDGPQALARLAAARRVDLVLMDWQMPGMDGLEVTRRLRQGEAGPAGRDVPIVALTANAFAEDRAACLAAGMNDFLTKPVLATALLAAVARWTPSAATATAPPAPSAPSPPSAPSAQPPAGGPPVFDPGVLAALPMVADGSAPEVADELLAMFDTTTAEALCDIDRAIADADLPRLQRLVHTLKSTSASVGALELAALAAGAEAGLRRGEPPAADLGQRLAAAWGRLQPQLQSRQRAAAPTLEAQP
ncbi:ATP-binding protein [Ideonella sp. DXS22W]|uniref:histidine kinase n=1 Tax=Pseudaquabacterium inlustre TaxID=2984192 RepID=A0ABU9CIU2_9BURK